MHEFQANKRNKHSQFSNPYVHFSSIHSKVSWKNLNPTKSLKFEF